MPPVEALTAPPVTEEALADEEGTEECSEGGMGGLDMPTRYRKPASLSPTVVM